MTSQIDSGKSEHKSALIKALILNICLVLILVVAGLAASSRALLANGLDNLSDAAVYALSYFALFKGIQWQVRAAKISGFMLIALALGVTIEAVRGFIYGTEPIGLVIIIVSIVAAIINIFSLRVLKETRSDNVNLRAAWRFSISDLLANLGAAIAGFLVIQFGSNLPDLIVGLIVACVAAREGVEILKDAERESGGQSES
jgi:cobalt-zinc-cadmium efflux system protein